MANERKRNQKKISDLHPGGGIIPPPKKMGRPQKQIDLEKLKVFLRLRPSLLDTAHFFECDIDTIEKLIKQNYGKTFSEFRDECFVHTKAHLIRKAIAEATKDKANTEMLKFALKNFCNWKDRFEADLNGKIEVAQAPTVIFAIDKDEK